MDALVDWEHGKTMRQPLESGGEYLPWYSPVVPTQASILDTWAVVWLLGETNTFQNIEEKLWM